MADVRDSLESCEKGEEEMIVETKLTFGSRVFYVGLDLTSWIWDMKYELENVEYFWGHDTKAHGRGHRAGIVYLAYGQIGRKAYGS